MGAVPQEAAEYYALPGVVTDVAELGGERLGTVPADPLAAARVARGLVISKGMLSRIYNMEPPAGRGTEVNVRRASDMLGVIRSRQPGGLLDELAPADRFVGNCRHFSVLTVALMRWVGVAARCRVGFKGATGFRVDHWIVEYQTGGTWARVDPQVDVSYQSGRPVATPPDWIPPIPEFITGGEAWLAYRAGRVDAEIFGVTGAGDDKGPAEIRGNAIRDLAALNKREVLPWDNWGRMEDSYSGRTGDDYDRLVDVIAAAANPGDELHPIIHCYDSHPELQVPDDLLE